MEQEIIQYNLLHQQIQPTKQNSFMTTLLPFVLWNDRITTEPTLNIFILEAMIIFTRFTNPSSPVHLFPHSNNFPTRTATDSTKNNLLRNWNIQLSSILLSNSLSVFLGFIWSHLLDNMITVLKLVKIVKHLHSIVPTRSWTSDSYQSKGLLVLNPLSP